MRLNHETTKYLAETLLFAAEQLRTTAQSMSAKGKREESARRLDSILAGDIFKDFRAQQHADSVAVAFAARYGEAPIESNIYSAYADAALVFKVETENDAIAFLQKLEIAETCSGAAFPASFMPVTKFEELSKRQRGQKYGDMHTRTSIWAKVGSKSAISTGCTVHAYVETPRGVAEIRCEVQHPTCYVTARFVEYRGGVRYEDVRVHDPLKLFTKGVRKLYASQGHINDFIVW